MTKKTKRDVKTKEYGDRDEWERESSHAVCVANKQGAGEALKKHQEYNYV